MLLNRWLGILALYLRYRGKLDCARGVLLGNYMVVLLVLLAVIICTMLAIVCVSMRGEKGRGRLGRCPAPRKAAGSDLAQGTAPAVVGTSTAFLFVAEQRYREWLTLILPAHSAGGNIGWFPVFGFCT